MHAPKESLSSNTKQNRALRPIATENRALRPRTTEKRQVKPEVRLMMNLNLERQVTNHLP
jgi:hypothetical protein